MLIIYKKINPKKQLEIFRTLDEYFRNEALKDFFFEMAYRSPLLDSTYYVVSCEVADLLLIKSTLKKEFVSTSLAISFCKLTKDTTIKHEWLKVAMEPILTEYVDKNADYILFEPATHELEVFNDLQAVVQGSGRIDVKIKLNSSIMTGVDGQYVIIYCYQ